MHAPHLLKSISKSQNTITTRKNLKSALDLQTVLEP